MKVWDTKRGIDRLNSQRQNETNEQCHWTLTCAKSKKLPVCVCEDGSPAAFVTKANVCQHRVHMLGQRPYNQE